MYPRRGLTAQLACVKHAASVHSEPGSNSPVENGDRLTRRLDGHFELGARSLFELMVSVASTIARRMTEVRQFLDPVFKEPAPELGSSSYVQPATLSSHSDSSVRGWIQPDGSATIRKVRPPVNPFFESFLAISPASETTRPDHAAARLGRRSQVE